MQYDEAKNTRKTVSVQEGDVFINPSSKMLDLAISRNEKWPLQTGELLTQLLEEKGLQKSRVIEASGLNATFAYQIFSGTRNPSRDRVLSLAFAIGLDFSEVQDLLYCAGAACLSWRSKRDALIIKSLSAKDSLAVADQRLFTAGESTISKFS